MRNIEQNKIIQNIAIYIILFLPTYWVYKEINTELSQTINQSIIFEGTHFTYLEYSERRMSLR